MSTLHAYLPTALRMNYGLLAKLLVTPVWRHALRGHDRVVALSSRMRDFYTSWLRDPDRLVTIPNGRNPPEDDGPPDADVLELLQRLKSAGPVLGAVGRLDAVKGFDQVIRVLAHEPTWQFVLLGEGRERDGLLALAEELGVADRVHLLGFRKDAQKLYPYFDVYTMVSHHEGLPLVLLEAAMNGVATVCSALDTMVEFFAADEVAYYEPGDLDGLRAAIGNALGDADAFGQAMHRRYLADYTRERMADAYLEVYRALAERAGETARGQTGA